jgi:H/ACA ribonucleoprotein complex non-core subunit NAF1
MKGSDASNVYDEEPADHELEFSDDEAESAFKSSLKRKYEYAVLFPLNT